MKFKVGVVTKTIKFLSASFETREEVDDYLLNIDEKEGLKRYRIEDDRGNLLETEEGTKGQNVQ